MPKYDYSCDGCEKTFERQVTIDNRDLQQCNCGANLRRLPHYHTLQIEIPTGFSQATTSDYPTRPENAEVAARWERDGVRAISDKGKWI